MKMYDSGVPGIEITNDIDIPLQSGTADIKYFEDSLPWEKPVLVRSNYWRTACDREKQIIYMNTKDDESSEVLISKRILPCTSGFDSSGSQSVTGHLSQNNLSQDSCDVDSDEFS